MINSETAILEGLCAQDIGKREGSLKFVGTLVFVIWGAKIEENFGEGNGTSVLWPGKSMAEKTQ